MPSGSSQPRPAPPDLHRASVNRPGVSNAPREPEQQFPREPWLFTPELAPQVAEPEPMPPEPDQVGLGEAGVIDEVIPVHDVLSRMDISYRADDVASRVDARCGSPNVSIHGP